MFYNQLSKLCKRYKTTPTAFVTEKLGLSSSKITAWKNGSIPKYGTLEDIANYFQVPISYLFQEDDEQLSNVLKDDEKQLISLFKGLSEENKARVLERAAVLAELDAPQQATVEKAMPLLSATADMPVHSGKTIDINFYDMPSSAGTGIFLDHTHYERRKIRRTSEAEQADFAIPINGDSMEPAFHSGDVVLVKSCPYVHEGEIGIFVLDGDAFIKQYGGDKLISLNEAYPPLMLSEYDSAVCLGRVLGIAEVLD